MAMQDLQEQASQKSERWYPPPQGEWVYEDYLQLPDNGKRYEIIKGELYMSPAPRPGHQKISVWLTAIFYHFVHQHNLGEVFHAPIDVILPGLTAPVQPDLLFVRQNNLHIVAETKIEGVPDLVVEIISPGNPSYDRETKFILYAEAGVKEYWIVDGEKKTIDVFVLRGQAYAPLGHFSAADEAFSEQLPDFTVRVGDLCA